jgi:hypothetical protein
VPSKIASPAEVHSCAATLDEMVDATNELLRTGGARTHHFTGHALFVWRVNTQAAPSLEGACKSRINPAMLIPLVGECIKAGWGGARLDSDGANQQLLLVP